MATEFSPRAAARHRRLLAANRIVQVLLALLVLGLAEYLAMRHPWRWTSPSAREWPLAPKTLRVLKSLRDGVSVHVLMRGENEATPPTRSLLAQVAASGAPVRVEWVDPDRDLARTEELCQAFRWHGGEAIFAETDGGERRAIVEADTLLESEPLPSGEGAETLYRGEGLLAGALYSLVQPARPVACFLQGHGEHSPDDFNRGSGYSEIAALLRNDQWDVETIRLDETRAIPARCAVLVVAGPREPLSATERARIRDYLDRKGRVLLLLNAGVDSGLEPLLREWGVATPPEVATDEPHTLNGRELHLGAWAAHPATRSLGGRQAVFYLPRPVEDAGGAPAPDKPRVTSLLATSGEGAAKVRPGDARGRPGPVSVAVAVERGPMPGVHSQLRPTRMVVVGDSDFASNAGLVGANASFFLNAANWLAEREEFLGVVPRETRLGRPAPAGSHAVQSLFWGLVAGVPLAWMLPWFVVWGRRRFRP